MSNFVLNVATWWIANAITSILSKKELSHSQDSSPAFVEMKWAELTIIQFIAGAVVSGLALKFIKGDSLPSMLQGDYKFLIILSNLLRHLSVNMSYCFTSSGTTQVIKSSEPIFMFVYLLILEDKEHRKKLSLTRFSSLVLMFLGTCLFLMWDSSFNIWGVLAAVVSNTAFPIRNIFLKKQKRSYGCALGKYFVLSFYGTLMLIPVLFTKTMTQQSERIMVSGLGVLAGSSHCIYNIASILVLEQVTPMNHAILNFSKRVIVIVVNLKYFNTIITWQMFLGLVMVAAGLSLYHINDANKSSWFMHSYRRYRKLAWLALAFFAGVCISGLVNTSLSLTSTNSYTARQYKYGRVVATSWVYHWPIPDQVIENIKLLHRYNPETNIFVYCGSLQCTSVIENLSNPKITAKFTIIPELLRNTSLKGWFMRHPLNKILAGEHFEDHLQEAVKLAHLWHYGGVFVAPTARVETDLFANELDEWITISPTLPPSSPSTIDISSFPPGHPFINYLMDSFIEKYANSRKLDVSFCFGNLSWYAYVKYCNSNTICPIFRANISATIPADAPSVLQKPNNVHFGTLSYGNHATMHGQCNLGDPVQSLPGLQFLPFVDFLFEREVPVAPTSQGNNTLFFNAWWAYNISWPPPNNIDPIMLAIHLTQKARVKISRFKKAINFLRSKEPIGCRDISTSVFLTSIGVKAFFSGCMTLLLQNPNRDQERGDKIYLVDIPKKYHALLPPSISKQTEVVRHMSKEKVDRKQFLLAYQLIEKYSRAKVVITQRIHAALPSVGMGIPVIFINDKALIGGSRSRASGLIELFHTLDTSTENVTAWFERFNWINPPPNPNLGARMRHVATFWNIIRKRHILYDTAHKFGLIPLTPRSIIGPSKILFHLIFEPLAGPELNNTFRWYHLRCVESIFRLHPNAKVVIHSNSLRQSTFDVLTEVGYAVEVKKYNIFDVAKDTPFETLVKADISSTGCVDFDLSRSLLLYKYGGIHVHMNTIIVKPMYDLAANVLGVSSEEDSAVFMKFEKNHTFLGDTIGQFFMKSKKVKIEFHFPLIWKYWTDEAQVRKVEIVSTKTFSEDNLEAECLDKQTEQSSSSLMQQDTRGSVYAVRLPLERIETEVKQKRNKKITPGTVCKHLLNSYCVLCNNMY